MSSIHDQQTEDLRFRVLKLLQARPDISQRDLARQLGISHGKMNYCLKALMDKGLVKLENFQNSQHKFNYAYLLTPAGISEKAALTGRFLTRKMAEYEALQAEIEALKAGAASAQYTADAYREDNPAVKAALEALARFEAGRSSEYSAVASGQKQVVEITIPAQDMYTREQVDALLAAVQQVQSIDARVTVLETPAKPGANQVLQDISRRY